MASQQPGYAQVQPNYPPGQPQYPPPGQPQYQAPPNGYPPQQQQQQQQQQPPPYAAAAPGGYPPQPQAGAYPPNSIQLQPTYPPQQAVVPMQQQLVVQNGVIGKLLVPPAPYAPPIDPSDPSISAIQFSGRALNSEETIYRCPPDTQKEVIHNFCLAYSHTPTTEIYCEGYHHVTRTVSGPNGSTRTETRKVVDWHLTFNPSQWILGPGQVLGLEEAVSRFADSTKTLKKLTIRKKVNWDYQTFTTMVENLARAKGYRHHVGVAYRFTNNSEKLSIEGSNSFNDCVNSKGCKIFCCITCLCICWYPIKSCATDDYHVVNEFQMAISPEDYLATVQHMFPTYNSHFTGCSVQ